MITVVFSRSGELQTCDGHRRTGVQDSTGAHFVPNFKPKVTKTEQVLEPEHFASPHLDELSGMTYLSYFMKVATSVTIILTPNTHLLKEEDSPGYYSTLNWVKHQIPNARINNFRVRDDAGSWLCWDGGRPWS